MGLSPTVGLYLYGWYNSQKWKSAKSLHTPAVGFYASTEAHLISWQISQISLTGIDFVVFELVPLEDHSFSNIISYVKQAIPLLKKQGIGFTFLVDFGVLDSRMDPLDSYTALLDYLDSAEILDQLYENPDLGKTLFLFSPYPDIIESLAERTPSPIRILSALWSPTWEYPDNSDWPSEMAKLFSRYWQPAQTTKQSLKEALESKGFFPFWQDTPDIIAMNGIASVTPGYDDLLLGRSPQMAPVVTRESGHTLVKQFQQAQRTNASTILLYGWNEYFEATTIEPTLEYGDFYLRLTSKLISQIKSGKKIQFPRSLEQDSTLEQGLTTDLLPTSARQPIYLTAALKKAAQSHADKLPRWDQDDYLANVRFYQTPIITQTHAIFSELHITNIGIKSWQIKTKKSPIRLGVRLCDLEQNIVREGRSELSTQDVQSEETVIAQLSIEIVGLPAAKYIAKVDIVWEEKFWFESPEGLSIHIDVPG